MSGEEMLKITADELEKLLSPSQVMGESIDLGDKVIVPIVKIGFGLGAGTGKGKEGDGSGSGGGGGISPVALVVVHKDVKGVDGIQVLPLGLEKGHVVAQIISTFSETLAPKIIEALKAYSERKEGKKEEGSDQTGNTDA